MNPVGEVAGGHGGVHGGNSDRIQPQRGTGNGVFAIIALAVRREDRQHSLTRPARSVAARSVRRLTGVGARDITPSAIWRQSAERVLL